MLLDIQLCWKKIAMIVNGDIIAMQVVGTLTHVTSIGYIYIGVKNDTH